MEKVLSYQEAKNTLTLTEKAGQLFMPAAFINDTEQEIQELEKMIKELHVGGLCFFHSRASAATNYEGRKEVIYNAESFDTLKQLIQRYQKAAKYPLLIAIDAEWGLAMRVENTPQYPYAITLGAIQGHSDLIFEVGRNIAQDCKAAGIHWNLAPVVDININPHNPVIGYRSFGENKKAVTEKAMAFVKGTQSEGVLTSIKHFPGHGDTATDSHLGLPLIDKSKKVLLLNELYPFQQLIDEGVDSVMVGHLSVPALANGIAISSSISKDIIQGVLRDTMGFQGVVISDALNMHAVSKNYPAKGELEWLAFDAGNDVLCFAEHIQEGIAVILQKATEKQLEDSFGRVWRLKEKAMQNTDVETDSVLGESNELNKKLALESLSLAMGKESDISNFRQEKFISISISQKSDNIFFKSIYINNNLTYLSSSDFSISDLQDQLGDDQNILLAVCPPQVKPTDNFGFSEGELNFINTLIQTRNVVLYLFGNPYVLNHIRFENAVAVVVAYQNFEVFQEVAGEHFLGNFRAKGKMPVSVKNYQPDE